MKYFVANWKAHKDVEAAEQWMHTFSQLLKEDTKVSQALTDGTIAVVICPPYPLLNIVRELLPSYPNISVGAQDISAYDEGDITGEVAGASLKGLVDTVIVGHSARRNTLKEDYQELSRKCAMAQKYGLKILFCVRGEQDRIPTGVAFVAYEPVNFIGTGDTQSLEEILSVKKGLPLPPETLFLYGAGVTQKSMGELLSSAEISGLLIGSASLDPSEFYEILVAAC